jgi:fatty acid desaturase
MQDTQERQWWNGEARKKLQPDVVEQARKWQVQENHSAIKQFDFFSRIKILFLFSCFLVVLALHTQFVDRTHISWLAIFVLGFFVIPYTRIFMHSQMHWGMGGSKVTHFVLDHFVSLLFSIPQTAYTLGHRMHHRFDNDFSSNGLTKDLQSTYIFSRNGGSPTGILIWVPYYMFAFQHFIAPFLVLRDGKPREKFWYVVELLVIIAFHLTLYYFVPHFYISAYIPGLLLAWLSSAIVLYMMHAVDANEYLIHPTNTSLSKFFNKFGDNDGYHLEHTLFPAVHPLYLPQLHKLIEPTGTQVFMDHYFVAGIKYIVSGTTNFRCPYLQKSELSIGENSCE